MVCFKIAGYLSVWIFMSKKNVPASEPASFEQAMAELDQLVTKMEAGELPLEASVAAYQRGSELVKYCAAQLDKVENQVKVLEGDMLKPFAADGATDNEEAA
jgi:exodeoxyribonuclease VII small subunit